LTYNILLIICYIGISVFVQRGEWNDDEKKEKLCHLRIFAWYWISWRRRWMVVEYAFAYIVVENKIESVSVVDFIYFFVGVQLR
jgi:hypothetical protein